MGVISDGNKYGFADNLIFSFPCVCKNGEWSVVGGLNIGADTYGKIKKSEEELVEERKMALGIWKGLEEIKKMKEKLIKSLG